MIEVHPDRRAKIIELVCVVFLEDLIDFDQFEETYVTSNIFLRKTFLNVLLISCVFG